MGTRAFFDKDLCGGILIIAIGATAAWAGVNYRIGTIRHMGPGFFPVAVGLAMVFVGTLMAASSLRTSIIGRTGDSKLTKASLPDFRGTACLVSGLILFVVCGKILGLLPATFAIVFVSALGDRSNSIKNATILAIAGCVVAVVVFWWGLDIQLPLFNGWSSTL